MSDAVIKVDSVSKKYCRTIKHTMLYGATDLGKSFLGLNQKTEDLRNGEFWAVDNLDFELKKGETLGIIGPNGSGKSTILKMLNGIFMPDRGQIDIEGRVGALIEVGSGFHPVLTGRENIYINGSILGMTKKEIDDKFDEIVDFSEIRDFIDSPVKHYSSGMSIRLGFAIAVCLQPEILLIDEVLSVGDLSFQNKSLRRLAEIREQANAVVFVSHNLDHVRNLCSKTLIINKGKPIFLGDTSEALSKYYALARQVRFEAIKQVNPAAKDIGHISTGDLIFNNLSVLNFSEEETARISTVDDIRLSFEFEVQKHIEKPSFSVGVLNERGEICIWHKNEDREVCFEPMTPGQYQLNVSYRNPSLVPGVYFLTFAVRDSYTGETFERLRKDEHCFIIEGKGVSRGIVECESEWGLKKIGDND